MKMSKIMSIAIAAMFVMGAFVILADSEESDATSAGSTNIFIYDGSSWSDHIGMAGYNALQALQATGKTIVADTDYILEKENDWGPYKEINSNYGVVTSISGIANNSASTWIVFTYNNGWSVGADAIGFITPFSDGASPSANVAFYYGADASSALDEVTAHVGSNIANLVIPAITNSSMVYTFQLKVSAGGYSPTVATGTNVLYMTSEGISTKELTASDLLTGITLVGVGSNAYAALKNAVGTNNIVATETPGGYYGWLNTLFGLTQQSSGSNYIYWTQNTASGSFLSFNLGSYSGLSDVPKDEESSNEVFVQNAFALEYVLYNYS